MNKVVSELLTRPKDLSNLPMVGLIVIATMSAVAGVALQTSIQTDEFVAQWQNQSHMLWTTQSKINEEIESKIGGLQQAVSWLGDQIVSIQHQLMLSCAWNVTIYCFTPAKYNASQCNWKQTKYNLQILRGISP
jgi:hypothetical protein